MVSVNTNAAAITALRTLQQTNATLDKTQNRISTGYKIGEAKDNAAYWAISVTLKSDNKSLGTVKDSLNLGAATVDTMYQGLNKAKDVLDEIKAKLTSATQAGVDRKAVQADVDALQDQLKSIANSSNFSGENWLSVNSGLSGFDANKTVVSSFSRSASNVISIGTIKIDTSSISLFDANTTAGSNIGILSSQVSLKKSDGTALTVGGTDSASVAPTVTGLGNSAVVTPGADLVTAEAAKAVLGTFDATGIQNTDRLTFNLKIDSGATTAITVSLATVTGGSAGTTLKTLVQGAIDTALGAGVATVNLDAGTQQFSISSNTTGSGSLATVTGLQTLDGDGTPTSVLGMSTTTVTGTPGSSSPSTVGIGTFSATGLDAHDRLSFGLTFGATTKTVQVSLASVTNQATFQSALQAAIDAQFGTGILSVTNSSTAISVQTVGNSALALNLSTGFTALDGNGSLSSTLGLANATDGGVTGVLAAAAQVKSATAFAGPLTLDANQTVTFDIAVDGGTAKTVTIDKARINTALNVTTGTVTSAADFATVVQSALTAASITNVTAAAITTPGGDYGKLSFTKTTSGLSGSIAVSNTQGNAGSDTVSVNDIDINSNAFNALSDTQKSDVLNAYISVVNEAINKVTSAAASLGSVASRIDLQKGFVDTLMDTIDKGVGNLVDADMSEESTKLQALQVKQQLGVQALSIANQSAQNILSLFQSK